MAQFTNLGDLIVRERDLSKIAVVDLGGETAPREYTYAQLDAMCMALCRQKNEVRMDLDLTLFSFLMATIKRMQK